MAMPRFYSASEAASKLGKTDDEVKDLVRDGKLREFRDRGQVFFKCEEVDRLAEALGQPQETLSLDDSSVAGAALSDESGTGGSSIGASTAGKGAVDDSAIGDSALGDSSIGASHAGTAATEEDDETGSSMGDYDLAAGSSVGLSGSELAMAPPGAKKPEDAGDQGDVGLSGSDVVAFKEDDAGKKRPGTGDDTDTVITSVGISVFDDDEIEIDVDPLAKTQVTPSVEDQISLEGVGSGSGLLDLTREADDTSLGAELLDEIYPGEEESTMQEDMPTEVVPGMAEGVVPAGTPFATGAPQPWAVVAPPPPDPAAAGFTAMMVVGAMMLCLTGTVLAGAVQGVVPSFLGALYSQWLVLVGGGIGLAGASLLVGWLVGRQTAGARGEPAQAAEPEAPVAEDQEEEEEKEEQE